MSDQITGNTTEWVPLSATSAAAFRTDPLGNPELFAVIAYRPTSDTLRTISARKALQRLAASPDKARMLQEDPPTEDEVRSADNAFAEAYGVRSEKHIDGFGTVVVRQIDPASAELLEATAPGELARRAGEDPDDFYRRVARAHKALSLFTDHPTAELARRAGVPAGTAASWVHYARKRGLLPKAGGRQ